MRRPAQRLALIVLLLASASAAADEELPKMVVMNFKVGKDVNPQTIKLLNDLMLNEFQSVGTHKVFGEQDMISMLNLEQTKLQTTGCADDACLAEIGGALGAQFLVSPNVGRIGTKFVLNMKMIDVNKAEAVGRSSRVIPGSEEELIAAVREAVNAVLNRKVTEPAPVVEPAAPALEAEVPARGIGWDVGAWGTAGLAVASLAGGVVSAVLAKQSFEDLEAAPEADRDRLTKLEDETRTRGVAADVLFVVAGVSAATSVLLFLLMPDDAPRSTAGFAPVPGGGVLTVRAPLPEWGW